MPDAFEKFLVTADQYIGQDDAVAILALKAERDRYRDALEHVADANLSRATLRVIAREALSGGGA